LAVLGLFHTRRMGDSSNAPGALAA
jgi:hypothetical protein